MDKILEIVRHPFAALIRATSRNAAAMLRTEMFFSLISCMYSPYVTMYMLALGLTELQVGFVASFTTAMQMVLCLLGAYLCDRFGRRNAMTVLDFFAWTVPMIFWALARDFAWFLAAAAFNSLFRVAMTPFQCFFVESTEPHKRVVGYSVMEIVVTAAGFVAPAGAFLVGRLGLVPAMRGLYLLMAINTFGIYLWRYFTTKENPIGEQKRQEMQGVPVMGVLKSYFAVGKRFFTSPTLLLVVLFKAFMDAATALRGTWFATYLTGTLGFAEEWPAYAATIGSILTLLSLGIIMPRVTPHAGKPQLLWAAIAVMALGCLTIILSPVGSVTFLVLYLVLHTAGISILSPCLQALIANEIPDSDRAAMNALMTFILMALQMPFGLLGGLAASGGNFRGPFVMILCAFAIAALILLPYAILKKKRMQS